MMWSEMNYVVRVTRQSLFVILSCGSYLSGQRMTSQSDQPGYDQWLLLTKQMTCGHYKLCGCSTWGGGWTMYGN